VSDDTRGAPAPGDDAAQPTAAVVWALVLGSFILAILAIWLLPLWLTQNPSLVTASERHKAAADARTGLVAFLAVLGAIGGLYYTSRTFRLSRDAQIAARQYADETTRLSVETLRLSERGQITDRYSKAVEMLGDPSHEVCIGGIYALGHIMRDSPAYERAIVAVLSAFIRRKAKRRDDHAVPWGVDEAERDEVKPSFPIQAALNVFVESRPSETPPDLRDSDLRGARLRSAQLRGAIFRRTYLYKAKLFGANLGGASLAEADLTEADLTYAILEDADLEGARLAVGALTQEQLKTVRNADKIVWVPTVSDSDLDLGSREAERADPLDTVGNDPSTFPEK
jgi:Pentapeptide repeats (8 copies)